MSRSNPKFSDPNAPKTHQELFAAFIDAEETIIHDRSTKQTEDRADLRRWAKEYAAAHGLKATAR